MLDFQSSYDADLEDALVRSISKAVESDTFMDYIESLDEDLARRIRAMILEISEITRPSEIEFIDGSEDQRKEILDGLLNDNLLMRLDEKEYPNSFLYRSSPTDVARTEGDTYICTTSSKDDVGPTNNWMHTDEAKKKLYSILKGSMSGKTMYVVPYWLGPLNSPFGMGGIEITDSPYVVSNLQIITKSGKQALKEMSRTNNIVLGIHATGTLDPKNRYITHFPDENNGQGLIISVNTNYGGNALLSKKCHALRIASVRGKREGWMAEHMMLIGIENPEGEVTYISGAFPSSSGKTNLSMLDPPEVFRKAGWKTWLVSDDIIWMHRNDGMLYAINPESGFFGVVPQTSYRTNPNAMETIKKNTIFTNVAVDDRKIPYWEGKNEPHTTLTDWKGNPYEGEGAAAHPNSRFTSPISQYPHLSKKYNDPSGAPVSAILYGGRRKDLIPLVYEPYNWAQGVLVGAMQRVETTAATTGKVGILRNDPMANRPFTAYNMADYFRHHLEIGATLKNPPKVFNVNWFRKDENGNFIWPGYSENMRVIKWIIDRARNRESSVIETPIGYVPDPAKVDFGNVSREALETLFHIDAKGFQNELEEVRPFLESFGDRMPGELWEEFHKIEERLSGWN